VKGHQPTSPGIPPRGYPGELVECFMGDSGVWGCLSATIGVALLLGCEPALLGQLLLFTPGPFLRRCPSGFLARGEVGREKVDWLTMTPWIRLKT
jgi:hypothetical protein